MFGEEEMVQDLRSLGIHDGDTVYIRSGLREFGQLKSPPALTVLNSLLTAVGPMGNVVAPAFTKLPPFRAVPIDPPSMDAPIYVGALSKAMLAHSAAHRSNHPTHSFVAIGHNAIDILAAHDLSVSCFEPMRKIIDLDGKMLLAGCVKSSPGFSTVHLAQYDLGLTQKHYARFAYPIRTVATFRIPDLRFLPESPGCSAGFGKLYADYVAAQNFTTGRIGDAWAICVGAREAYECDLRALKARPLCVLCDNPICPDCRLTRGYNKREMPLAWIKFGLKKIGFS